MSTWKNIFDAKFRVFKTGFIAGLISWGSLLFGSSLPSHSIGGQILYYSLKAIATFALAFGTAIATVGGTDFYKWVWPRLKKWFKKKFGKKKSLPNYGESFSDNGHSSNHKKSA